MDVYQRLGVPTVINARGHLTVLGGAVLSAEVAAAMTEASRQFVDLPELQRRVGARVAELTGNEAAYVCNGASAGLLLAALACLTGTDRRRVRRLPALAEPTPEIVVPRRHRVPPDSVLALSGARIVEFGDAIGTTAEDLADAISDRTAAVVVMAGSFLYAGPLTVAEAVRVGHAHGVPVLVDAAAQLPPGSNLWHFTGRLGADLAVFSGGKALCGPQSSGLVLGRADLVEAISRLGPPNPTVARGMKVGKEEMVGLLVALERFLGTDEATQRAGYEKLVAGWVDALQGCPALVASRAFPSGGGQPVPRVRLRLDPDGPWTPPALHAALYAGSPPIAVDLDPNTAELFLAPETVTAEQAVVVTDRLWQLCRAGPAADPSTRAHDRPDGTAAGTPASAR